MTLSKAITEDLKRISVTLPDVEGSTAIPVPIHDVIKPDIDFVSSTERARKLLIEKGGAM